MRHPDDPELVRDTKATATFWLGVLAVVTGLTLGGAVPATLALILAGQARRDLADSEGWRRGSRLVTVGERLAWIALGLVAISLLTAVIIAIWRRTHAPAHDFPPSIN